MITTAFVYLAGVMISAILLILSPLGFDNGFPEGLQTGVDFLATYIGKADVFIPLDAVLDVITFAIAFEISILTFYVLRWLFSYMPFVGGK